jgi:DNA-binding response OmpR family regulator
MSPSRVRVLLVDDDRDTCSLMTSVLARRGYDVLVAEDAAGALRIARERDFDVLVSDLGLPDASGVDLMGALKEIRGSVVGIAITGSAADEDVRRCREAGFAVHMTKPINLRRLEETLEALASKTALASKANG